MNSKKVFEGRQLLLVVAVFGILLMHITSADDEGVEDTTSPTAAPTVVSPGETTVEVTSETQETPETVPGAVSVTIATSRTQYATDLSSVETTTPTIVAGGTVTDDAKTSTGVHSTADAESNLGQNQSNDTSKSTVVGSTAEAGTEGNTVTLVSTTGGTTSEETNASLGNAKETTTENVASTRETTAVDTTTVAPYDIDSILFVEHDPSDNFMGNIGADTQPSSQATTGLAESSKGESAISSKGESAISSTVASTAEIKKSSSAPVAESDDPKQKSPNMRNPDIWEAHRGLFLTVLILISVCVVVTVVCCLCMAWRGRGRERHPDKQPISMEEAREAPTAVSNPIPDAEMIRDEAPMQERENPAVTPNGGGQHISKADEDNGWVVPLDELSKAEKEKPEVENTRL